MNQGRGVFLSAGEPSGDLHGAALASELLRQDKTLRLYGLGGEGMAAAGVQLLAGLDELAVMGLAEVGRRLPKLVAIRRRVRDFLIRENVELFLPVDYPEFNLPMAAFARKHHKRVLYYIAPQVWAWRERRARHLARNCDLVCVVLPFEEDLMIDYGVPVQFVGHPLLDEMPESLRERDGCDAADLAALEGPPVLSLFPGSRVQEVRRMLPIFAAAARCITSMRPEVKVLVAVAPHLPRHLYAEARLARLVTPEQALRESTAALSKSGTATLQLALAGVPMVVGYSTSRLTYRVARRLVRVPHISLVNLVAGKRLVPELVQDDLRPETLIDAVLPLLDHRSHARQVMLEGLFRVRRQLGEPGCASRVARHARSLLSSEA